MLFRMIALILFVLIGTLYIVIYGGYLLGMVLIFDPAFADKNSRGEDWLGFITKEFPKTLKEVFMYGLPH